MTDDTKICIAAALIIEIGALANSSGHPFISAIHDAERTGRFNKYRATPLFHNTENM